MQTSNYHDSSKKLPNFLLVALVLCCLLSLSACGRGESNVELGNREGVLYVGNGTEPQTLDPHIATGIPESQIISALFEGLIQKNPETLEVEPAVAESWEISDDGTVYTFTLRPNAKWSNGDSVTAQDFEWSWWRALQPVLGNQYVFMLYPVVNAKEYSEGKVTDFDKVGIKALSDSVLQITLANPTPYFLQLLDHSSTYPLHRPTIEKWGKADESYTRWTRPENLVGNGPFKIDEWRLNKVLTVERNDLYWNNEQNKLNGIRFYPIDSPAVEERMFRAGQLHFTSSGVIERLDYYKENNPSVLNIAPYAGTYFYRFNTKKKHLDDVRVRKALAMSIDRALLTRAVLKSLPTPSYAMTPPGLLGYQAPKEFSYNPDLARQLMAEAGFAEGKGFPNFELQFNTSEGHRKLAIAIQQMWKKELGINISLQNKDWKVYLDDVNTGNFDISRAGWIGDYVDPNTFLDMWGSDSGLNQTGWGSDEYDRLVLTQAPEAKTRKERYEALQEAESILINAMPIIPIYTYSSHYYKHQSVSGMPNNIMNYKNFRFVSLDANWQLNSTEAE